MLNQNAELLSPTQRREADLERIKYHVEMSRGYGLLKRMNEILGDEGKPFDKKQVTYAVSVYHPSHLRLQLDNPKRAECSTLENTFSGCQSWFVPSHYFFPNHRERDAVPVGVYLTEKSVVAVEESGHSNAYGGLPEAVLAADFTPVIAVYGWASYDHGLLPGRGLVVVNLDQGPLIVQSGKGVEKVIDYGEKADLSVMELDSKGNLRRGEDGEIIGGSVTCQGSSAQWKFVSVGRAIPLGFSLGENEFTPLAIIRDIAPELR